MSEPRRRIGTRAGSMREHARMLCERAVTLEWCAKQRARARRYALGRD